MASELLISQTRHGLRLSVTDLSTQRHRKNDMNAGAAPGTPLDGLLTCGNCGEPMTFDGGGPKPRYGCRSRPENDPGRCETPDLNADAADDLILNAVLRTVMTQRNTGTVLYSANEPRPEDGPQGEIITAEVIQGLIRHPSLLIRAVGGLAITQQFLRRFISRIEIHPEMAIVRYSLPLPADSPLAGKLCQQIELLPEALA